MKNLKNTLFLITFALFVNQVFAMETGGNGKQEKEKEKKEAATKKTFDEPNAVIKFTNNTKRNLNIVYKMDKKYEKSILAPGKTFTINTLITKVNEWDYSDLLPFQSYGAEFKDKSFKIIDTENNKTYETLIKITRIAKLITIEAYLNDMDTGTPVVSQHQQTDTDVNTKESFNIEYIFQGNNNLDATEIDLIIMQSSL